LEKLVCLRISEIRGQTRPTCAPEHISCRA
jgi:hypothetical protein